MLLSSTSAFLGNGRASLAPARAQAPASSRGALQVVAGLKEVRDRIASVKNTMKITDAMKLVAAAKVRRAQEAVINGRPFTENLIKVRPRQQGARQRRHGVLDGGGGPGLGRGRGCASCCLLGWAPPSLLLLLQKFHVSCPSPSLVLVGGVQVLYGVNLRIRSEDVDSPLCSVRPVKSVLLVVLTGDRGLCGGYNNFIIKKVRGAEGGDNSRRRAQQQHGHHHQRGSTMDEAVPRMQVAFKEEGAHTARALLCSDGSSSSSFLALAAALLRLVPYICLRRAADREAREGAHGHGRQGPIGVRRPQGLAVLQQAEAVHDQQ